MTDERTYDSKLTLTVTEEDIAEGIPKDPFCCPLAEALRRLPHVWGSRVLPQGYEICLVNPNDYDGKVYLLPDDALDFIQRFDAGEKVKPETFVMDETSPDQWGFLLE